jgi:hypothetical protein
MSLKSLSWVTATICLPETHFAFIFLSVLWVCFLQCVSPPKLCMYFLHPHSSRILACLWFLVLTTLTVLNRISNIISVKGSC